MAIDQSSQPATKSGLYDSRASPLKISDGPKVGSQHLKLYTMCGDQCLKLYQDVSLRDHSTMRVGGPAKRFAKVRNAAEVKCAYGWAIANDMPVCTIGSGSNIIWPDAGYPGLVLQNEIKGFEIVSQNDNVTELRIGAGEVLDDVVERSVKMGWTGMECLSLIPGTIGGAVIQNSGAYGHELEQVLQHVDVYDTCFRRFIKFKKDACGLGYRTSRFKNEEPGRYFILGLTLRLWKGLPMSISHPALLAVLKDSPSRTPEEIRSAVIAIRKKKLPDPAVVPNCGSFFMNPIISRESVIAALRSAGAPLYFLESGNYKVPAAWLIEHCGLKDNVDTRLGYGTWPGQPLVLFATRQSSCDNLLKYSETIAQAVRVQFGITLDREPVLMGG